VTKKIVIGLQNYRSPSHQY